MTTLRALTMICLLSLSMPALAIYKCETNGRVTYSDTACLGGQALDFAAPATDTASAGQQLAREKSELKRLENERHRREAKEEKEQQRAARAWASRKKTCDGLTRRVKWAQEDSSLSKGKSAEKAKRRARRLTEQYDAECAK